jgi:hypothetical protein
LIIAGGEKIAAELQRQRESENLKLEIWNSGTLEHWNYKIWNLIFGICLVRQLADGAWNLEFKI